LAYSGVSNTTIGLNNNNIINKSYADANYASSSSLTSYAPVSNQIKRYLLTGSPGLQTRCYAVTATLPSNLRIIGVTGFAPSASSGTSMCRITHSLVSLTTTNQMTVFIGDSATGYLFNGYYIEIYTVPNSGCDVTLGNNAGFVSISANTVLYPS
jgi:hypothetical protein